VRRAFPQTVRAPSDLLLKSQQQEMLLNRQNEMLLPDPLPSFTLDCFVDFCRGRRNVKGTVDLSLTSVSTVSAPAPRSLARLFDSPSLGLAGVT